MKTKLLSAIAVASLLLTPLASSAETKLGETVSVKSAVQINATRGNDENEVEARSAIQVNATTTKEREDNDNDGEMKGENHRSEVASFVLGMNRMADRDEKIGERVREIARDQDRNASTSADKIEKVKNRKGFKRFLFGEDYKNLGDLRSEIVHTQNNIDKLNSILASTTDTTIRAQLSLQIAALQDLKVKEDAFVTAREKAFSLFGWFVKPFVK